MKCSCTPWLQKWWIYWSVPRRDCTVVDRTLAVTGRVSATSLGDVIIYHLDRGTALRLSSMHYRDLAICCHLVWRCVYQHLIAIQALKNLIEGRYSPGAADVFLEFLQIQMSNGLALLVAHGLLTLLISSVCIWPSLLINVGISSSVERKYMLDINRV